MDPLSAVRDRYRQIFDDAATTAKASLLDELPLLPDAPMLLPSLPFLSTHAEREMYISPASAKRTESASEMGVRNTRPDPETLVGKLSARWPALTETGARTLAAQVAHETGANGAHCYNGNLGNIKGGAGSPHQYLGHTWEVEFADERRGRRRQRQGAGARRG